MPKLPSYHPIKRSYNRFKLSEIYTEIGRQADRDGALWGAYLHGFIAAIEQAALRDGETVEEYRKEIRSLTSIDCDEETQKATGLTRASIVAAK